MCSDSFTNLVKERNSPSLFIDGWTSNWLENRNKKLVVEGLIPSWGKICTYQYHSLFPGPGCLIFMPDRLVSVSQCVMVNWYLFICSYSYIFIKFTNSKSRSNRDHSNISR